MTSAAAHVWPHSVEAEERVLGALLLAGSGGFVPGREIAEMLRSVGLQQEHFYRKSHGLIYKTAAELLAEGRPCDAPLVVELLHERGELDKAGGEARVRELAALVPAVSNAPHFARIVRQKAMQRAVLAELSPVMDAARNGSFDPAQTEQHLNRVLEEIAGQEASSRENADPFQGLTHGEVLELTFDAEPAELIEGLVPKGVLMTVAGLPETGKGWVCLQIARAVASGEGEVFGRSALAQGAVGYVWQDDSTRNEAERVQLFAQRHETPVTLPIRWFLNEGLMLPRDLDRLRRTIEVYELVVLILDSFYNVPGDLDLKDRDAGVLFARLKSDICDATGCTVIVVDHMPWATDTNRRRLRSYGDVFKNAAVRAGIYIDVEGSKLYVEARGNNIRGFKRTPAYFDEESLELRLVDTTSQEEADDELDSRVLEWLTQHPGRHSTTKVREAIKGRSTRVDQALQRLCDRDEVRDLDRKGGTWSGRPGFPRYWTASDHAVSTSSPLFGTTTDEVPSAVSQSETPSHPSHPRRGDGGLTGRGLGGVFLVSSGLHLELPESVLERLVEDIVERVRTELAEASPWMSRQAAAAYLDVPVSRLEKDKSVPHHRWDGRVRYDRRELDEWLRSQ